MSLDHSQTYKTKSLKNLPHRQRLKTILSRLDACVPSGDIRYADFGCSNGYITDIIARRYAITSAHGFDYEEDHMAAAREQYPQIEFKTANLNLPEAAESFDLVTCFETLEHVGDLSHALAHLLSSTKKGGLLFISVPIEIGLRGLIKFTAKSTLYRSRYQSDLSELSDEKVGLEYFLALLRNKDISRFREKRDRWGTHYGFDYRVIDRILKENSILFSGINHFTTRFYSIEI